MSSIYHISEEFAKIYDEIEANEGEITEEIEEALKITQESLKSKVRDYVSVIKSINDDIDAISVEQKRLKALSDSKKKLVDRLKDTILTAIDAFGDCNSKGVKFIDYGIGKVSIRRSTSVDVNSDNVKSIAKAIDFYMAATKANNQLDVESNIDFEELKAFLDDSDALPLTIDDLKHLDLEVKIKIPAYDLIDGSAYEIPKEIAKYSDNWEISPSVDKTNLKKCLTEDGSCAPNIAKLSNNKNLTIK
jgi:hypothetical protein